MLVNKQKKLESNASSFAILSCSASNSSFFASVASLVFQSEFSTRLEISDLLTIYLYFISASSMSLINLL